VSEPCPACNRHPCEGSHRNCNLEVYAAHRGLTVEQVGHQELFRRARVRAYLLKWVPASVLDAPHAYPPGYDGPLDERTPGLFRVRSIPSQADRAKPDPEKL
jgi:hypothetical protein